MRMLFRILIVFQVYYFLPTVKKEMSIEEGIEFVRNKLERSFNKLSLGSKEFYKDKYIQVMEILH